MYTSISQIDKNNPFPNYHSVRLKRPVFKSYAYKKDMMGKGIDAVIGIRQKSGKYGGKSEIQSLRFNADTWPINRMRNWLKKHPDIKPLQIERADRRSNPEKKTRTVKDELGRAPVQTKYAKAPDDPEKFSEMVRKASTAISAQSTKLNENIGYKKVFNRDELKKMGIAPYFFGATSEKVLHSAISQKWYNAVIYLAPAEMGMLSFCVEYPYLVSPLIKSIQDAAQKHDEFFKFKSVDRHLLEKYLQDIDRLQKKTEITMEDRSPNSNNLVRPFTVCPTASPNCRAVCLNKSGHGAMNKKKIRESMYNEARATGLVKDGITLTDEYELFYLKGIQNYYGGASNAIIGSRIRRTHAMWMSWAREGVIQNSFNDMLFYEITAMKTFCDRVGIPLALRFNGTSDIPFHIMKLNNASWGGISLKGKNLFEVLGKMGIICYDYTKDFTKMKNWLASRAWQGPEKVLQKQVKMKAGFPSNYYLSFSWSEINGRTALDVLRKGGNVVMVFRQSVEVKKRDELKVPIKSGEKGIMPDVLPIAQLSRNEADKKWRATVINGDEHDLRFLDPFTPSKPGSGRVVGLTPKGDAYKPYTSEERRELWQHFSNPTVLKKVAGKIEARIRPNPPDEEIEAIEAVDYDIYNAATSLIDGFVITTTAMGT